MLFTKLNHTAFSTVSVEQRKSPRPMDTSSQHFKTNSGKMQRIKGFSTTMRYINRHYLSIYLSVCLFVCVCLSVYLSIYLTDLFHSLFVHPIIISCGTIIASGL